ncbi:MAG: carbohydrate kinase [Ruminococcaceae bacterium]|nr:carbohydrate kinase [Oscillospiraceae bacterium]
MAFVKEYGLVAFGEALIDFISKGEGLYQANPGGAPFNLSVCAAKGGVKTAFIGKVGNDSFGKMLADTARKYGVDTKGMVLDDSRPTTHAFVTVNTDGDNGFAFCRDGCADASITVEEADAGLVRSSSLFHFGGLSLAVEPCKSALMHLLSVAAEEKISISFDPNYRPFLWQDEKAFVNACLSLPVKIQLLKVSENEARLLSGGSDLDKAMDILLGYAETVLITLGADGVMYGKGDKRGRVYGFPAAVKDTTGAGDIFLGSFIAGAVTLGRDVSRLSSEEIESLALKACAIAAKSTEKEGAIPSIPEISF